MMVILLSAMACSGGAGITETITQTQTTTVIPPMITKTVTQTVTQTQTKTTTATSSAITPTTTTPLPTTWGELSGSGQLMFMYDCSGCHGVDGQGGAAPANIGSSLRLFETAQRLFNYISISAPCSLPGSLSNLRSLQILAFMLVESNFIQPEGVFDENNLANVPLNE
jgi:hypothetical protein